MTVGVAAPLLFTVAGRTVGVVETAVLALALVGLLLGGRLVLAGARTVVAVGVAFVVRHALVSGATALGGVGIAETVVDGGTVSVLQQGVDWILTLLLGTPGA